MTRWLIVCLSSIWCAGLILMGCAKSPNGQTVFIESGCARCHEIDGSGGSQGPRLEGLASKWTSVSLDQFLADPPEYVKKDARLQAYQDDYVTPMPKFVIEPARRKMLVEFLLERYP